MGSSKQMPRSTANRVGNWRLLPHRLVVLAGLIMVSSCSTNAEIEAIEVTTTARASDASTTSTSVPSTSGTSPSTTTVTAADELPAVDLPQRPSWLGTRDLTLPDGSIATGLETPPELLDRRFATVDVLPAPDLDDGFTATIAPLEGSILEASTWEIGCPVPVEELRYLTMTFWGFDDRPHTGEMIVNASVADDVVGVFAALFDARFPIEAMRVITDADLAAPNSGDGNITSAFVCRAVRGGSTFSEHAYGLAIDVNPFLNPYLRGDVLLPELARHYLARDLDAPGQITAGDVVTTAFADIGWEWGGTWSSLVDYQHFALNNR